MHSSEAMFTDEERAEFYRKIPPMMYHFPHMFFMQQRMQQAQLEQQMQQDRYQSQPSVVWICFND